MASPSPATPPHPFPSAQVTAALGRAARWNIPEVLFWLVAVGAYFALPTRHLILNEIAILGLFAVSLDLILGYAGIVSLGHAAFFGLGAYVAGLLAKHGFGDPLLGLAVAAAAAALLGLVTSFLVLRGADLTKLMVTLGVLRWCWARSPTRCRGSPAGRTACRAST